MFNLDNLEDNLFIKQKQARGVALHRMINVFDLGEEFEEELMDLIRKFRIRGLNIKNVTWDTATEPLTKKERQDARYEV